MSSDEPRALYSNMNTSMQSLSLGSLDDGSNSNHDTPKPKITVNEAMDKWFADLPKVNVDLIGDFGGTQLFLIDFDSILYHLLTNPSMYHLMLHGNDSWATFSVLALVFQVEKFLNDLLVRKAVFKLVAFDTVGFHFASSCSPLFRQRMRTFREIVIGHVCKICDQSNGRMTFHRFKHWVGDSLWASFLIENKPYFIILSDGTAEIQEDNETLTERMSSVWISLISHCLHREVSIALIGDITFKYNLVTAFVIYQSGYRTRKNFHNYYPLVHDHDDNDKDDSEAGLTKELLDICSNKGGLRLAFTAIFIQNGNFDKLSFGNSDGILKYMSRILLISQLLLDELPLSHRSFDLNTKGLPDAVSMFARVFLESYYKKTSSLLTSTKISGLTQSLDNNLHDYFDEKLFFALILTFHGKSFHDEWFTSIRERYELISKLLFQTDVFDVPQQFTSLSNYSFTKNSLILYETRPLLPVYHEELALFDLCDKTASNGKEDESTVHFALRHWHTTKAITDYPTRLNEKQLRSNQKYILFVHRYSSYLTGMTGVYGNTIIAQNKKNTKMKPPKQSRAAKNIVEQNIIRKKEQEASRMFIQFRKLQAEISDLSDVKKAMETIQSRSSNMKEIPIIEMCLEWLKITVCLKELQQTKVSTNDTVILLLKTIQHILRSPELAVPTILKGDLKKIVEWLQFPALISMIKDSHIEFTLSVEQLNHFPRLCIPKHSFQFQDKKITSWVRFQLVYMGQNLSAERMNKPQKDDRVPFVPDEWQTRLLDIVDKNESALVCCPTSSGKTFCAYYAMQKVLESNDEDVVVYVAPTKALVNQVAAEIYARFKKNYPNGERTVWGIFTRDYRHEATRCQVLVTVPEMLGIIMLSPTNVSFSRRIKRVIFDEIHCIGQLDSGVVWEQLLMICQCPILCLSATIGNPEHLFSWLQKLQERHSINMHLIIHETRHVEIDKFYYNNEAEGTGFEFNQIHPWSCVDWTKSKNIMHVKLSSLETLQAFDALMELEAHENIDSPEVYFQNGLIDRLDVINYQNYIAGFVLRLGCDAFKDFTAKLRKYPSTGIDNIIDVLRGLRKNDMLPAIVFTFDRASCEESALSLLEHVQKLENLDIRYVQKKKKIEEEAQREAAAKTKLSSKALLELEKKGKTKPPENGTGFTARYFDYRKYSYISQKSGISNEEVDKIIDEALFRMPPHLLCLIECLRKGIGVHHGGLPRKYLYAVETLMRCEFITVVFGTGTLALGINMPCRTVVMFKDSMFLNVLNYHQMSGRAGRRGFDLKGQVIFCGIGPEKVDRLVSDKLPPISGKFPYTVTLILRLASLFTANEEIYHSNKKSQTKAQAEIKLNCDYAKKLFHGIMADSFLIFGKNRKSSESMHFIRFSIEYLRRVELIDFRFRPINMAGAAIQLFYTEPSNLIFTYLLSKGVFHKICAGVKERPGRTCENLMEVLCHLFNVVLEKRRRGREEQDMMRSPSKIFLDPLSKDSQSEINLHNAEVLRIFTDYCASYYDDHLGSAVKMSCSLPLSGTEFVARRTENFDYCFRAYMVENRLRNPFSALAATHLFDSVYDLSSHVHPAIHLECSAVPFFYCPSMNGRKVNSYLKDFYSHGQIRAIERDNGIKQGTSWTLLKDFSLILKTIFSALLSLQEENDEHANVTMAFGMILEEFDGKFKSI